MPAKIKPTRKLKTKKSTEELNDFVFEDSKEAEQTPSGPRLSRKLIYFAIGIVVVLLVGYFGKGIFLAALVNGHPVTRWQLDRELEKKDNSATLDNLVNEILIESELSKQKTEVSNADIDNELNTIKQNLPSNTTLDNALKQQGMTLDDLKKQIVVKLKVEKILDPKVSISDKEVDDYITQNPSSLSSTDSAKQKEEAKQFIRQQKLGESFNAWLTGLKSKANILLFPL